MNMPAPSLIYGLDADRYHADPGVSNSMLSAMARSPAHCWALYLDPNRPEHEPTDAMATGTLAHAMILEPQEFESRYTIRPEGLSFATKEGKAWRDAVPAGRKIITADQYTAVCRMREAVERVATVRALLGDGKAEASVFWNDADTGLRCRARPDWLHWRTGQARRVVALDVKTIADLSDHAVERAITTYGYHRQAAHYTNGLRSQGRQVEAFGFVFVSTSYPYLAAAYLLDDETAEQGHEEVAELMAKFAECKARNEWPAFGDEFRFSGLQKWARRSQEVEVSFVEG